MYKSLTPPYVSLEQILSTQITDDHLKCVAYTMFRALFYLHSMELVLLDLFPGHIFVNESVVTNTEFDIGSKGSYVRITTTTKCLGMWVSAGIGLLKLS